MAASGIITLREGIPVIMGSNVGTSVTSTMISLTSLNNLEEYRLGFSAATIHDLFNWCTIIVLLPLEMGTGMLEKISGGRNHQNDRINIELEGAITLNPSNGTATGQLLVNIHSLFDPVINSLVELKSEGPYLEMKF